MKQPDKNPLILVIDDDRAICSAMTLLLKRSGFLCHCLNRPHEVMPYLEQEQPQLIILDMNFTVDTSGRQGLKLLKEVRTTHPNIPIILMTGWATIDLAVRGMKAGAKDFIAKPWNNKNLVQNIRTILALTGTISEKDSNSWNSFSQIIGQDPGLLEILDLAKRISQTDASVLIEGESGTGKELIAEAIHYESKRSNGPFVKVNLGGISASLFESELFGHKKGAFTDAIADRQGRFAKADKGTIFLDEIGEMDLNSQVKLLRVLQEKSFEVLGSSQTIHTDFRVVCATNKPLEDLVSKNLFREDLFYRINLIHLKIPPLRKRKGDIRLLVSFFLQNMRNIYDRPNLQIADEALEWLDQQAFPGNIRQLKNVVERAVLLSTKDLLNPQDFHSHYSGGQQTDSLPPVGTLSLEEMEIQMIKRAMAHHQNQISLAAKSLGITRHALYRRLQKYKLHEDA